ncbi:MAG TPA: MCE family protein [Acidimicrobiales bacterium]|nr:MCE family protein [Acidimicrobiales bacterium]
MSGLSRGARAAGAFAVVLALFAVGTVIVKGAYGGFSNQYLLVGYFDRTGNGLFNGSEVQHDGVTVGKVSGISLAGGRAKVDMRIDRGFVVPADATAVISPKNAFGDETVGLQFQAGDTSPALRPGGEVAHTQVQDQITQFLAVADPLLNSINGTDLGTVVDELSQASAGQGPTIAANFAEGSKLADLLSRTVDQQIAALQAFTGTITALAPAGATLNAIADANNQFLPVFNAQADAYQRVLAAFGPVADQLAAYLRDYHPNIATLLVDGDNPSRVLIADQQNISQVIHGLYRYTYKFATGISPETLPDGSRFAYFRSFILFSDVNKMICGMIAPAQPGLSFLKPLQQALAGAGTPLDCSAQMAAFNAAQAGGPTVPSPTAAVSGAAQALSNQIGAVIGAPQPPAAAGGLGSVIDNVLGGGS